ncbi:FAD-binding protein [Legionella israelensis]|uniref:L-gululonolactone oxidase n=1 Tax=Legionella israelensis TaxID=454 RepID=A0A0W0VUH9_9GAMM|nr:FAD-binding protein [Legionella israelensis]KTD23695.1 L-gululonolactone oxidase [Legionella israelensis]QBS10923.1 FAD-binding oxidoreductase [Legionella israelensis]SCX79857.1 FAD/FMN-containing dehydrogenase [Legionella israelensis DSM 19235]STX57913.1 oxidoreductase (L-gululonolactone oxidase) [Legionella israelensis]
MRSQKRSFTSFSKATQSQGRGLRPEREDQLESCFDKRSEHGFLARGQGLSYNDCCLNNQGYLIETNRLNHFLSFDTDTGLVVCQAAVSFADLFSLHPGFIPPVIPGTVHVTLAGGIANDVHGKNNPVAGCFSDHVEWFNLQTGHQSRRCSREENSELFFATIAGLGLTGIITRIGVKLRPGSQYVNVNKTSFTELPFLLEQMIEDKTRVDYQAAWVDLLNTPRALLFQAQETQDTCEDKFKTFSLPKLPVRLIYPWFMKQFNCWYFKRKIKRTCQTVIEYNNPLDKIKHWNRLYGQKGFIQFQGVFDEKDAYKTIQHLLEIIRTHKATPTLAVLKLLDRHGSGLLSFCQPGFTLAIDFIHDQSARNAITAMNQFLCDTGGKVYLAKDLLLNPEQFQHMYPKHEEFSNILKEYRSPMQSDLGRRLGILK